METERPSPRYSTIDLWDPSDILDAMLEGQFAAVAAVHAARPALERAALAVEERLRAGGRLVYAGAGTSGRLAVQDGAELMPTFSWPARAAGAADGRRARCAAARRRRRRGRDRAGRRAAARHHGSASKDALIAVAASGTTPFTVACLREAATRGALTVGIANNPSTPLLDEADHPVWLDTGAEPIAGSTRMKAGTAQRVALTLLSSLVMIRLGHVYRGADGRCAGDQQQAGAAQRDDARATDRPRPRQRARGAAPGRRQRQAGAAAARRQSASTRRGRRSTAAGGDLRAAKELVESGRNRKRRA